MQQKIGCLSRDKIAFRSAFFDQRVAPALQTLTREALCCAAMAPRSTGGWDVVEGGKTPLPLTECETPESELDSAAGGEIRMAQSLSRSSPTAYPILMVTTRPVATLGVSARNRIIK
jgi:hypothetical protein